MKQDEYKIQEKIGELVNEYQTLNVAQKHDKLDISDPQIIISETFA